jgi:hypothetical protein
MPLEELRRRAQDPPDEPGARRALVAEMQRRVALRQTMPTDPPAQQVRVVDVSMRFESMIVFMLKWAIASIPAMIILSIVGAILFVFIAAIGAALRH